MGYNRIPGQGPSEECCAIVLEDEKVLGEFMRKKSFSFHDYQMWV